MDSQSQHLHQFNHQQPPPPPPQHHHQPPPPPPQHHQQTPPPPPQHLQQPPPPPPQHHQLQPHQQQQLNLPNNNNNSYPPNNPTPSPPPGMPTTLISPQHQFQQNQEMQAARNPNSGGPFNSLVVANLGAGVVDAIVPATASGGGSEQAKKKRGRPRKYSSEEAAASAGGLNGGDHSGGAKKSRGKPLGPGNKRLDVSGAAPVGITAHVIYVNAGEDIAYTIMTFAQQGPDSVCILSATGSIRNATLRQAARSGGNVTYEGQFEIISLAGTFHPSENGGRAGALSISLVGSDGHMLGGSVSGMLVAATPIQLVMGTFTSDFKKQKAKLPSAAPSSSILNFSAPVSGVASSPSQGPSSESSEDNNNSPPDNAQGPNINAGQPMQNMSMYSPVTFAYPIKMPPN